MIVIIKYNAGNIKSVENAVKRLGFECIVTDDPSLIKNAEKVIFPGVGEAKSAMEYLIEKNLDQLIINLKQPFLGICLGLQLMCKSSEEGNTVCLGIFDSVVKKFPKTDLVPHIGWNTIENISGPLLNNININSHFYFVHSYYASVSNSTIATCNYINTFSAAFQKDNFFATQFHPEKSAEEGEQVLRNFLSL